MSLGILKYRVKTTEKMVSDYIHMEENNHLFGSTGIVNIYFSLEKYLLNANSLRTVILVLGIETV